LVRRVRLALRWRKTAAAWAEENERHPRAHRRVRRAIQGSQEARDELRRLDDRLLLHAGDGTRRRPRRQLLQSATLSAPVRPRADTPDSNNSDSVARSAARATRRDPPHTHAADS